MSPRRSRWSLIRCPTCSIPTSRKFSEEIRKTYDYYHHMDQQANHAEVIPDWLVDKFAIAGTRRSMPRANRAHPENRHPTDLRLSPTARRGGREETIRGFAKAMS